jgi:hypothetical protein
MLGLDFAIKNVAFSTVSVQVHSGSATPPAKKTKHVDPILKLISATLNVRGKRTLHIYDESGAGEEIPMGGSDNNAYLWSPFTAEHAVTVGDASWYIDALT